MAVEPCSFVRRWLRTRVRSEGAFVSTAVLSVAVTFGGATLDALDTLKVEVTPRPARRALSQSLPSTTESAPIAWQLQLVSEGGITGKGLGSLGARSDGTLQLLEPAPPRDPALGRSAYEPVCSMPLTGAQAAGLTKAVAAARPAQWEARYAESKNPYVGGDQVLWTFTFERTSPSKGVERRVVQWVGERDFTLPADLDSLRTLLLSMKPAGSCTM